MKHRGLLFCLVLVMPLVALGQETPPILTPALPSAAEMLTPVDNNLALGNPSGANMTDKNNWSVEHAEYALGYDQSAGGAKWVSWHLTQSDRGKFSRGNNFAPDPLLDMEAQVRPNDYRGSGYDRGHQCPSADRTASRAANDATFYMSNMLPQAPDLNRELWRKFEEYCRTQLKGGSNELYIVTGGVGSAGRIADEKINVPTSCWKIVVILPTGEDDLARINEKTRVVAVMMPNKNGPEIAKGKWRDYLVSVDSIEEQTKLDFLSNLPKATQDALETKVDSGRASAGGDADDDEGDKTGNAETQE